MEGPNGSRNGMDWYLQREFLGTWGPPLFRKNWFATSFFLLFFMYNEGIYFYTRPFLCLGELYVIVYADGGFWGEEVAFRRQASMAAGEREAGGGKRKAGFSFPS